MKNFKYCAISLYMVGTYRWNEWSIRFTEPLILISRKFQSKYIDTMKSALCAPIAQAAIKQLLSRA